jgi:parvulin-like peptidyl-prolyl isomerase
VNDLRSREWIEQQMTSQGNATEDECQNFYDTHPQNFLQRARFRASHVFLAAPLETPPDVVETKQKTINSLAARIKQGEKLADVAIATSEDEATKTRGGDLGFFSESRMPLDFFYAVVEMHVEEISQPIRTRLEFDCGSLARSETCTATLALSGIRKLLRCLLAFLPAA